jgi:hypothetical protein
MLLYGCSLSKKAPNCDRNVQCVKGLVDEKTLYVVGKFHNIFHTENAHFVPSILDLK